MSLFSFSFCFFSFFWGVGFLFPFLFLLFSVFFSFSRCLSLFSFFLSLSLKLFVLAWNAVLRSLVRPLCLLRVPAVGGPSCSILEEGLEGVLVGRPADGFYGCPNNSLQTLLQIFPF